ncbi:MAG: excisionase family DNA-binding protein [Parvularculaceae bacterium]|nr:excisionase family DNA-binding protein [Parvularculaceae bacterium]
MLALLDQREPFVADDAEAAMAKTAAAKLRAVAAAGQDIKISVAGGTGVVAPLPARAVKLICDILEAMSEQIPMSIIPHDAELTTQQAADFLNVSRPFLTRQLEAGAMRYRKVGSHRRIRFADLIEYQRRSQKEQETSLNQLAAEAIRLGLD